MALADMYELVHNMTLFDKEVLNVYHVERDNAAEKAADISDAFQNSILPTLRLYQVDAVINNSTLVFNLEDTEDFGTFTLSAATGSRAVSPSPRFVSPGTRFPSSNRAIRSGFKRFPGASEVDYADGVLNATATTLLENIGDDLIGNWLASSDSHVVGNYVIIKRVCKTTDPVTGKCLVYRLPKTDGELEFFKPTSRIVQLNVSSQVSRK